MGVDRNVNMSSIGLAVGYNEYLVDSVRPWLGSRVLDVGCGAGNTTSHIRTDYVVGIDTSEFYLAEFRRRLPSVHAIHGDINSRHALEIIKSHKIDTVFSSNVLEHIEDDQTTLTNIYHLLPQDGILTLIVPNYSWLHGPLDEDVGHFRRYDRRTLRDVAERAGFRITKLFAINMPGIVWWYLNSTVRKKTQMEEGDSSLVDATIPVVRLLDRVLFNSIGLSLVLIARK